MMRTSLRRTAVLAMAVPLAVAGARRFGSRNRPAGPKGMFQWAAEMVRRTMGQSSRRMRRR
jgi:hypothetical protein